MYAWSNPRWEDYEYELKEELEGGMFGWFGNGYCTSQLEGKDTTRYLDNTPVLLESLTVSK